MHGCTIKLDGLWFEQLSGIGSNYDKAMCESANNPYSNKVVISGSSRAACSKTNESTAYLLRAGHPRY